MVGAEAWFGTMNRSEYKLDKITETPMERSGFGGGDHWGTDAVIGQLINRITIKPWGFGNTAVVL